VKRAATALSLALLATSCGDGKAKGKKQGAEEAPGAAATARSAVPAARPFSPLAAEKIPDVVRRVSNGSVRGGVASEGSVEVADLPDRAVDAALAGTFCIGFSLWRALAQSDPRPIAFALKDPELVKDALACGKKLASALPPDARFWALEWETTGEDAALYEIGLGSIEAPAGRLEKLPDSAGLEHVRAFRGWDGQPLPFGYGRLTGSGLWAAGMIPVLRGLGAALASDAKSTRNWAGAFSLGWAADRITSAGRPELIADLLGVTWYGTLPVPTDPAFVALVDAVKSAGSPWISTSTYGWGERRLEFAAPSAESAERIRGALEGWRAHLVKQGPTAVAEGMRALPPGETRAAVELDVKVTRAALDRAKVTVTGTRVSFVVDARPGETAEKNEDQRLVGLGKKRAEKIDEVLKLLARGSKPTDEELEAATSKAFVTAVKAAL